MRSLAIFNSKAGVGATTLGFNVAHMLARQGARTVVLDCDPQSDISALFLGEEALLDIWHGEGEASTVSRCIALTPQGEADLRAPELQEVAEHLWLLPGDLALSRLEQPLAEAWAASTAPDPLLITTALDRLATLAAESVDADVVLFDAAPSLGALPRSALLACDAIVVPLTPDLFSLQSLQFLGSTLTEWRQRWRSQSRKALLPHAFEPIGYIVQQPPSRSAPSPRSHAHALSQLPALFHHHVLGEPDPRPESLDDDPSCLGILKHSATLLPIAQRVRKPMFDLKRADGIGSAQIQAVAQCRQDFEHLTQKLLDRLPTPPPSPARSLGEEGVGASGRGNARPV